jgi:hypothetical protein
MLDMKGKSSNTIFYSLNGLFQLPSKVIPMDSTRIGGIFFCCPPLGLSNFSNAKVNDAVSIADKQPPGGSSPNNYSSFRESPAPDAQLLVGQITGLHEMCIERDSRAAFTLSRYPSPSEIKPDFEVRKSRTSLVTDESHFTKASARPKGQGAERTVKSGDCPNVVNKSYHGDFLLSFEKVFCFLFSLFSSLPYFVCSLKRFVGINTGSKRCIGDVHFPEYPGESSCHCGSGFSFDTCSFDKSFISFSEVGIELRHFEGGLAQSPSQRGGTCLGNLAGIFLSVGDVRSFCKSGPAGNGVGVFEPMKITELSCDYKSQYRTDAFWRSDDVDRFLKFFISLDYRPDLTEYCVSLPFDAVYDFKVLPENLSLYPVELVTVCNEPTMQRSSRDVFGATGVCVEKLPASDDFYSRGRLCESVPLPPEHSQMPYMQGWNISRREIFAFHDLCDFGGADFIGVGLARPNLAEVECVEQMDFVSQRFEQVPQPVIGSHGFDADAQRPWQRFDEADDFSGAVVRDSGFNNIAGVGIKRGIGRSRRVQIDSKKGFEMLRSSDKIAHRKSLHVRGKKNRLNWRQDTIS